MANRCVTRQRSLATFLRAPIHRRSKVQLRSVLRRSLQPQFEPLEERRLLAVTLTGGGTWIEQGPGAISNGQVEGIPNQPVVGAVQAIAVNPTSSEVYLGTVNGGVWRTANISSATNPGWTPLTDAMESLSIGAIAISSTDTNFVVAGTGSFSNGAGRGGRSVGVYVTEDGGGTWNQRGRSTFLDQPIRSIALTQQVVNAQTVDAILVGTDQGAAAHKPGVFVSYDRGVRWESLSGRGGLPDGIVTDIEIDPGVPGNASHPKTFYVGMPNKGIYRSTDLANWTQVRTLTQLTGTGETPIGNIQLGIHRNGTSNAVFAGLVDSNGNFYAVIRSTDRGAAWGALGGGFFADLTPGAQGIKNFSLVASPRHDDVVYIGGDRQRSTTGNPNGCKDFSANIVRGDSTGWNALVCSSATNTSPHADSRAIAYVKSSAGEVLDYILEADDGGIYRLNNPEASTSLAIDRKWDSRIGTTNSLRITEVNSVAYDSVNDIFFSGHQDTGSAEQPTSGALQWSAAVISATRAMKGDGQKNLFNIVDGKAFRYSMGNNLNFFYQRRFDNVNGVPTQFDLPADAAGTDNIAQDLFPNLTSAGIGVNDVNQMSTLGCFCQVPAEFSTIASHSDQMLFGYYDLYEMDATNQIVTTVEAIPARNSDRFNFVSAVAYGGRGLNAAGTVVNDGRVIYAARGGNIAVRQAGKLFGDPLSNPNGFNVSKNFIRDIVVNPDEWRIAYAIDSTSIYRTKDGTNGQEWVKLKLGNLSDLTTEIFSIEIYNPTNNPNDEIILVGARGGVFYSNNARSSAPVWRELGGTTGGTGQLPNAAVADVHFDAGKDRISQTADDLIYVGTYGRGVWRLNNPQAALSGELTVTGTAAADTITLKRTDATPNSTLSVIVNGTTDTFALSMLDKILVNSLGGNDTIIIDNSNGVIATSSKVTQPALILVDGGDNTDTLQLIPNAVGLSADIDGPDSIGFGGVQIRSNPTASRAAAVSNIQFSHIENPINSQIQSNLVNKLGFAFELVASASKTPAQKGGETAIGNLVESLSGSALRDTGPAANDAVTAIVQRGIVRDGLGEIARQFFASADFSLSDLGTVLTDSDTLRMKLDGLDTEPDNVVKSEANGVLRYDIEINKAISGVSLLDLGIKDGAFAGLLSLEGGLRLTANATLRLVIGVDAQGKIFIDPAGALDTNNEPIPFITLSNIQGVADGKGRLGMFEATLKSATISTDPDLAVEISMVDPNPDDTDPMIRLKDLDLENGEIFTVGVTSSPDDGVADISFDGRFDVTLFNTTLFSNRQLTIQWQDALNPREGTILPGGGDSSIFNTLAAGIDQVTSGILLLANTVEDATGTDLLPTKIPLLNKTLGEVLNQNPGPFLVAANTLYNVSPPTSDVETGENEFGVRFVGDDLLKKGLSIGGDVFYTSRSGANVTGKLKSIDSAGFVVSYAGPLDAGTPATTTTYALPRAGGLSARLRSLSEGFAFQIPTIQELIDHLADLTGIDSIRNVQVVGTLGQSNFGIQFPIQFIPDPIQYQLPLDFADKIASLRLDASASAQVMVQPTFNLTVGISLAAKKADGSDFSPLERVFVVATSDPNPTAGSAPPTGLPIVGVNMTLQLDNPSLKGSVGFLDVTLSESGSGSSNKGIKLDLVGSIHFVDPDVGVADQRIPLNLFTSGFASIVAFDFDGSLDIDGLTAAASVGSLNALAGVSISLEGEGGDEAPGHFETLAELGQVLGRIQVGAFTQFDQFKNISAADVLAALDLLVGKLQATGRGDVFSKPIPIVNQSVADLIDLGQVYLDTVGKPDNDSSTATAGKLQDFINAKLAAAGLPATTEIIVSPDAIRFKFTVAKSFPRTVPLAFQFGANGLSIDGNANIALTATGTLNLTLGILTASGLPLDERFFLDTNNVSPATASGVNVALEANVGYTTPSQPTPPAPLGLDVVLGPIGFHVTDGRVLLGLNVGANLQTANANKRVPLKDLGSASIQPTFNGSVQAVIPIDGDSSGGVVGSRPNTLTGDDALILVGGKFTNLGNLTPTFATTSTLALPAGLSTPIADTSLPTQLRIEAIKVVELINKQFLNFGTLIEGLERLLEWGDKALDLDILDRKIPFLGKSVRDGLNFLESDQPGAKTLRTVIQALVTNGGSGLQANTSSAAVDAALTVLRNALANIPNVSPISDFNLDGVTNSLDLIVPTKNGTETTGALVRFKYNPSFTTSRPFDLGIDFLNLQATGNVALNTNLELNIGVGITKSEGFFLITDLTQPEFKVGGRIDADVDIAAKLGMLDVNLSVEPGSYMSVDFSMNVVDPSGDGKLTLSELTNFSQLPAMVPSNNVQLIVETHLVGLFSTASTRTNKLPSFSAGINVDWRVADTFQQDGFRGIDLLHLSGLPTAQKTPQVKIVNVTLDVGSFVTSIVKPIFEKITESGLIPPQLKTALDTDIPLLNKKIKNLLRDAVVANPNLTQAQKDSRLRVFDLLLNITTFLSDAESLVAQASGDSLRLNFGDINVTASASDPTKPAPTPTLTDAAVTVTQKGVTGPQDPTQTTPGGISIPGSGIPVIKNFIKKLGDMGIFFPILRLGNLVQLIVGNDTDIVLMDLPELKIEKTFNQTFPLIGGGLGDIVRLEVAAFLGGGFTFTAHLAGGFDTSGLRHGKFVDGFYLGDFDPNSTGSANGQIDPVDKERPEIQFTGFVQAGIVGQAEVVGFDVGEIEGYFRITAEVNVDLNDDNEINGVAPPCDTRTVEERHDGKLHFNEIATIKQSHDNKLLSILELDGALFAELGLHITVLGGLLYDKQFSKRFDILTFDSLTFPVKCPPEPGNGDSCSSTGSAGNDLGAPVVNNNGLFDISIPPQDLAEIEDDPLIAIAEDFNGNPFDGGGINTYDPSDFTIAGVLDGFSFTLNRGAGDLPEQGVQIGQGVTFTQNGVQSAGVITEVSTNSFTVRNFSGALPSGPRSLAASTSISVYSPNETLVLQQAGVVETFGPASCGDNELPNGTGSIGSITTQDEKVGLGSGDNTFHVNSSVFVPVKIAGGRGNDTIIGGSGPITIDGGPGNDTIQVGTLFSGSVPPGANIKGGSGRDTIFGGRGSDIILGEEGDDAIFDDAVVFRSSSSAGNDVIVGGGGKDTVVSRGGTDELVGDYHEQLDRRPSVAGDQKEDADVIRHESSDKATIFGDNRGATPGEPGVKASPSRSTENTILTRGTSDETFSSLGDKFQPVVSKGVVRITETLVNPIIGSSSFTAAGLRQLPISASHTVEIASATDTLNILADSSGTTVTVSAITNGIKIGFAGGPTYNVRGVTSLVLNGGAASDTLVLDFATGNPIPSAGANFIGQPSSKTTFDQIRIVGSGSELLSATNRGLQTGSLTLGGRVVKFSSVKSAEASKLGALSWQAAKTSDVYTVSATTGTGSAPAGRVLGSSNGNLATTWVFFDVPAVTLDAGIGDATTVNDTININTSGLLARGLSNLKVSTGDGNDTISVAGASLNLPTTANRLTVDAGVGVDQLNITGDFDFSLNGDTNAVTSAMLGSLSMLGMGLATDNIKLVGGDSANRFILTNWPGSVTLDGAAGTDFVTLTMRGGSVTTIDELSLTSNVTVNSGGTALVGGRLNLGSSTRTFNVADGTDLQDLIVNAVLTGSAGLTKTGAGTMTLSQINPLTGLYTVSAGSLLVDDQQSNAVALSGGIIGGRGRVGAITGSAGGINPGITAGVLTTQGNLSLTGPAAFQVELNGTTTGTTGKTYDQLSVIGTVTLNKPTLTTSVGFSSTPGNTYRIIDNDGTDAVSGTFANLAEGATFVASGFTFQITYRGGTGNDVVLTHVSNTAPAFQNRTVTPTVDESGLVTVTGMITEPDVGDLFTLVVDWGDGTATEQFEFDPAQGRDVRIDHRYLDNPGAASSNERVISLLWRDQHGAANVGELITTIQNVAPSVLARSGSGDGARLKGSGQFTDPGHDSWFASVDYGSGQGEQALPLSPTGTFELEHVYDAAGFYTVKVKVSDDDGGIGENSFPVRVEVDNDGQFYLLSWRNPRLNVDVNNDGFVVPLDVLLVINELNHTQSNDLLARLSELDVSNPLYIDSSGDGYLSALDALLIINYLATQPSDSAAEGEATFDASIKGGAPSATSVPSSSLLASVATSSATALSSPASLLSPAWATPQSVRSPDWEPEGVDFAVREFPSATDGRSAKSKAIFSAIGGVEQGPNLLGRVAARLGGDGFATVHANGPVERLNDEDASSFEELLDAISSDVALARSDKGGFRQHFRS